MQGATIEELFHTLESTLLAYAVRIVGDRALAEDAVQEAFMKLHVQFHEVRERPRWLFRTVHNLALNHLRRDRKIVPLVASEEGGAADSPDPAPAPDEQLARWETVGLVRSQIDALDARSRELVQLKFHDGLSYQEMSARTGLSVGNVGYLLHHALKAMAGELSKRGAVR